MQSGLAGWVLLSCKRAAHAPGGKGGGLCTLTLVCWRVVLMALRRALVPVLRASVHLGRAVVHQHSSNSASWLLRRASVCWMLDAAAAGLLRVLYQATARVLPLARVVYMCVACAREKHCPAMQH
jgi:hypothetical protein